MRIWHINGKIIFNYVLEIDNFIENVPNINIMVLNIVQYQFPRINLENCIFLKKNQLLENV